MHYYMHARASHSFITLSHVEILHGGFKFDDFPPIHQIQNLVKSLPSYILRPDSQPSLFRSRPAGFEAG